MTKIRTWKGHSSYLVPGMIQTWVVRNGITEDSAESRKSIAEANNRQGG